MRTVTVWLMLLVLCGCGDERAPQTTQRDRPLLATTFLPMTFITKALVGDAADVVCPIPADADPGQWRPTREGLGVFQSADLIIYNGARFEAWMQTASLPRSRLVDTSADLKEPFIHHTESVTHAHGGGKEHTHAQRDGHTWLDPLTLKQQAAEALIALRKLLPKHDFTSAVADLDKKLDALDAGFRSLGALPEGGVLAAGHPAYNYLARRYGWTMVNFHFDPSDTLDDEAIGEIQEKLKGHKARYFLWEDAPTTDTVARLKAIGLTSVILRPAEQPIAGETYLSIMKKNVEALAPVFEKGN